MSGRSCHLNIELVDKPGQLLNVSKIIAELGGNVTAVHHEHASAGSDVNGCYLRLSLENRIEEVCQEAQYWRGESERMRKMLMRCSMNGIDDEIAEELEMMAIADVRMQDFLSE